MDYTYICIGVVSYYIGILTFTILTLLLLIKYHLIIMSFFFGNYLVYNLFIYLKFNICNN